MDAAQVVENLRIARRRMRWTQEDLARALDVDKSTVSRHEAQDRKNVDLDYVFRAASALGVAAEAILGVGAVNETGPRYGFTARERDLIHHFRRLEEPDQRFVEGFIAGRLEGKT